MLLCFVIHQKYHNLKISQQESKSVKNYLNHKTTLEFNINLKQKQKMMMLMTSACKNASQKLIKINVGVAESNQQTIFSKINDLIKKDVRSMRQMKDYIKAMKKLDLSPENILKYAVFVQAFLSMANQINEVKLIEFLNFLLSQSQSSINSFTQNYRTITNQNEHEDDIMVNHCSTTREDQVILCKQVFLLNNIIKSYIGFLLKFIDYFQDYKLLKNKDKLENYEAWKLVNLLKMIIGFSRHFTMVGRYFMKSYGTLIVLLIDTIQADIKVFVGLLKNYVTLQNRLLSCMTFSGQQEEKSVKQFARILQEISSLNEALIQIYLGKYFYVYLRDISQPDWINTNSSQFDTIFKRWQSIKKDEIQSPSSFHKMIYPSISTNSEEKRT